MKPVQIYGVVIGAVLLGGGGFVGCQIMRFDASIAKPYDLPLPQIAASDDPAVIERCR